MPITNVSQIKRFAELSGADFPKDLAARFEHVADDEAKVVRLGVEVATAFCKELLAVGAPALHFYTLNRSTSAREVYQALQSS
jgi:methylenetetrahydrofolate reductase (NADPH)